MTIRISDIAGVEVEHLIGLTTGLPLVKLRVLGDRGPVALGQLEPAAAREIAQHLLEAAARAEYEHDLISEAERAGIPLAAIGDIVNMVRAGEERRHTEPTE